MSKQSRSKQKKNVEKAKKKFFNPRVRQELWDADYLDSLPPKEKAWYLKFMSEYVNSSLTLTKDPLIKEYAKENKIQYKTAKLEMKGGGYTPIKTEGNPVKGHLHTKKSQAKEIFDSNNRRNNDVLGVTKINGLLEGDIHGTAMKKDIWHETDPNATEEALNWTIDYKRNPAMTKRQYKKKSK